MPIEKILKFLITGTFNSLLNILIVFLLINQSIEAYLASVAGFLSGAISGYFLNFFWTFQNKNNIGTKLIKYIFLQIFTLLVGISIFSFYFYVFNQNALTAQLIAIFFTAMINFYVSNNFIFYRK
jgi:putative flippase GtrA